MSENQQPKTIQDGQVVTLGYTLTVDGKVIDTSEGKKSAPVQFIQGEGQIVRGLEKALYGMAEGESKVVIVPSAEGYGEYNPNAFENVPRNQFPPNIPLKPGVNLQLRNNKGETREATIVSVDNNTVRLTYNHALAGKELHFSVKVLGIRAATAEELEHKHVHG